MSKLTRKTRHSRIQFTVNDDSESQPPVYIHINQVLRTFLRAHDIFSVCHCTAIVINAHINTQSFGEHLCQRFLTKSQMRIAAACFRIYSPGHTNTNIQNLWFVARKFIDKCFYFLTDMFQTFRCIFQFERNFHLGLKHIPLKVDSPQA